MIPSCLQNDSNTSDVTNNTLVETIVTDCAHSFGDWVVIKQASCVEMGVLERTCSKCGFKESSKIEKSTTHTEIVIPSSAPTCTQTGLTEGKKCAVCGEILQAQEIIEITSHAVVIDEAIPASCISSGLTEGSHCSLCNTVLIKQETIPALGHSFNDAEVKEVASCQNNGLYIYHCKRCEYSYSEEYSLPVYSASEIYEQAVKYTGVIITYDKSGSELALGTGFVVTAMAIYLQTIMSLRMHIQLSLNLIIKNTLWRLSQVLMLI